MLYVFYFLKLCLNYIIVSVHWVASDGSIPFNTTGHVLEITKQPTQTSTVTYSCLKNVLNEAEETVKTIRINYEGKDIWLICEDVLIKSKTILSCLMYIVKINFKKSRRLTTMWWCFWMYMAIVSFHPVTFCYQIRKPFHLVSIIIRF